MMLEAITGIAHAVNSPVTVDFEAGYGDTLDQVVDSITKVIATGIVGINIEDSVDLSRTLVDATEFCEKISAIRELSESLGFHLVINARTDSFYTSSASPQEKLAESILHGSSRGPDPQAPARRSGVAL